MFGQDRGKTLAQDGACLAENRLRRRVTAFRPVGNLFYGLCFGVNAGPHGVSVHDAAFGRIILQDAVPKREIVYGNQRRLHIVLQNLPVYIY